LGDGADLAVVIEKNRAYTGGAGVKSKDVGHNMVGNCKVNVT
jgi:hypothetical protein